MRMYEYMIVILLNYRFKGIDHTTAVNHVPIILPAVNIYSYARKCVL